jgi:hypothetical protein
LDGNIVPVKPRSVKNNSKNKTLIMSSILFSNKHCADGKGDSAKTAVSGATELFSSSKNSSSPATVQGAPRRYAPEHGD